MWFVVDILLGLAPLAALWVRRRYPFAVGLLTISLSAVSGLAHGAAVAGMFTAGVYCPSRRTIELFGLSIASSAVYPLLYRSPDGRYDVTALAFGIFLMLVAVIFGAFVRARRELVMSLHARNRTLQAEQQLRVAEARRAERNRIAREMHDVLAHRISLLAVHAGALEFHPDAPPEQIAKAAAVIRESARAAQEELREVIGVLRADPVDTPPPAHGDAGGGSEAGVEPPQPTLSDLERLVQESREAGMEVRLATAVHASALPPTLSRTVYRVVQEAVTNARKHAPGQLVTILVVGGRIGVRVSVTNQPAVGHAIDAPAGAHVGSGTGLIGMAERVALAGGQLEHGRLPGGGFRLAATLPWPLETAG
jgi:signal transduction histidine kinase